MRSPRAARCCEALGDRIFRVGPLGAGHALKALNNYLAAAAYAATAEALAVGQAYGLDPETLISVVNTSTGRSFSTEHVYAEHVVTGRYATGFAAGLLAKDVAIAADIARSGRDRHAGARPGQRALGAGDRRAPAGRRPLRGAQAVVRPGERRCG